MVGKLTGGLAGDGEDAQGDGGARASARSSTSTTCVQVDGKTIRFTSAIIAAGSQAAKLPFLPEDPRIVDSTGALELKSVPKKMLVIGGGIIGLEMGTVYSTLGTRLDVVEMMDGLMLGADRDLVAVWQKFNAPRFDKVMLKTKTTKVEAAKDGLQGLLRGRRGEDLRHDPGLGRPRAERQEDRRGEGRRRRRPSAASSRPIQQMRTNVAQHLRHRRHRRQPDARAQGGARRPRRRRGGRRAEVALRRARRSRRWPTPIPEIAWVGLTEDEAKKNGTAIGVAKFPWAASGRAIANARDEGFTKLIFDAETHRVVGGGIVGTGAGDLISELALAVEMGADATDIGKTIHPHPTISESVGMAAELFEGVCTDLPPQKKEMNQDELKELVAREALKHVVEDAIVGVGSGSTVFKFIDALATIKGTHRGRGGRVRGERRAAEEARHPRVRPEQRRTSCRCTSTAPTRSPSTCT